MKMTEGIALDVEAGAKPSESFDGKLADVDGAAGKEDSAPLRREFSLSSFFKFMFTTKEGLFNVTVTAITLLFFFVFVIWAPKPPGKETHHTKTRDNIPLLSGIGSTPFSYAIDLGDEYDILDIHLALQRSSVEGASILWGLEAQTKDSDGLLQVWGPRTVQLDSVEEVEDSELIDVHKELRSRQISRGSLRSLRLRVVSNPPGTSVGFMWDMKQMGPVGRHTVMIAALILGITYILMITDMASKALIAIIGSFVAVAAVTAIHGAEHLSAILAAINFPTLAIVFGMMLMVGMLSTTGFIEWVGGRAVIMSQGSAWRLLCILGAVSWIMGALMDCVTTMCVVIPITLSVCRMVGVQEDHTGLILISMALFGNVGGAATLIGDPPNIVLGASVPGIRFSDFIVYQSPGILMATIPFGIYLYVAFGRKIANNPNMDFEKVRRETAAAVHNPGRLYRVLFIVSIALLAMFLVPVHGQDIAWIAVVLAFFLLLITCPKDIHEGLKQVDFETLLYLGGLFVLVQACLQLGLMDAVGEMLASAIEQRPEGTQRRITAYVLLLWVSGGICTLLDNSAFTVAMVPVLIYLSETLDLPIKPITFSLSMGACLGANSSIYGAAANSVILGLAKQGGINISSYQFTKLGAPATLILLSTCTLYVCTVFGLGEYGA